MNNKNTKNTVNPATKNLFSLKFETGSYKICQLNRQILLAILYFFSLETKNLFKNLHGLYMCLLPFI